MHITADRLLGSLPLFQNQQCHGPEPGSGSIMGNTEYREEWHEVLETKLEGPAGTVKSLTFQEPWFCQPENVRLDVLSRPFGEVPSHSLAIPVKKRPSRSTLQTETCLVHVYSDGNSVICHSGI